MRLGHERFTKNVPAAYVEVESIDRESVARQANTVAAATRLTRTPFERSFDHQLWRPESARRCAPRVHLRGQRDAAAVGVVPRDTQEAVRPGTELELMLL